MFRHYFKTAWRNLTANKFYSILNLSGLAVGLATGIMLLLWVQNEFSYDKFNRQHKNIFFINTEMVSNGSPVTWPVSPGPLAVLAKKIPEIKYFVRTGYDHGTLSDATETKIIDNNRMLDVDSNFFDVFDYKLLYGNKKDFLPNAQSIVLTEKTAKKLFGTSNAIGKTVRFQKNNFTVTAVMENFPVNSTMQEDALLPMAYYAQKFTAGGGNGDWKTIDEDMGDFNFGSYVLLYPNANPQRVVKQLSLLYNDARKNEKEYINDGHSPFKFQNLANLHLTANDGSKSDLHQVEALMIIAIFILLIASINYVNLSTARSLIRLKEVSVKKIIGASKGQLFIQFIVETLLLFSMAFTLAIGLIFALTPLYNSITGKHLSFALIGIHTLFILLCVIVGTLSASSIYPAMLLSSFKPLAVMRGAKAGGFNTATLRKTLVVLQFVISFMLLVGTFVIGKQMRYMRNKDLGYDKSYVFKVPFPGNATNHFDAIQSELKNEKSITSTGITDEYDITNQQSSSTDLEWSGKPSNAQLNISQVSADKGFISTMKYHFIEGNNFIGAPADSNKYILNETAVRQMRLKPPYVGQPISFHGRKGEITGVLKDFNFKPLTEAITPLIFFTFWNRSVLYVRTTGAGAQDAIKAVEKQYKKYADKTELFSYDFLDKTFEAHYQSQQRAGTLFTTFAAIAIFISCLGLFGLATYTAQVKTKEIGIRKVLGASVSSIVQLISKDFLKLIIVAVIIASPLAYWTMNKWLGNFAYKTTIGVFTFIAAALVVLVIVFGTIGFKAFKAARANPVKSLKTE